MAKMTPAQQRRIDQEELFCAHEVVNNIATLTWFGDKRKSWKNKIIQQVENIRYPEKGNIDYYISRGLIRTDKENCRQYVRAELIE